VFDVGVLAEGDGTVANVTSACELHTFLGALNGDCDVLVCCVCKSTRLYELTRLRKSGQIPSDLGELRARHGNSRSVLGVRNAKVLLINVHELDIILAQSVALSALEDQVDDIRRVLGLEGQDVFVLCAAQDFCEGGEVDAERKVAVAAEGREGFGLEHHGDKGDVGVVHGLERDSGVIAVEVAVLHKILDGIDDLCRESACAVQVYEWINHLTFFNSCACSRRASNTVRMLAMFSFVLFVIRTLGGLCGCVWRV
jgi:hypothetical protein